MEHRLPAISIAVHDNPIALLVDAEFSGQVLGCQKQIADVARGLGSQVVDRGNLDFGHNHDVVRRLRVNVQKGANPVGFVNDFSGNLPPDDLGKKGCHNAFIFAKVGLMSKKLFVGNLPFEVNDADLASVLGVAGKVESAKVVINKKTGRSKGYGFVEMATEELAQEAVAKFEGATLNERPITVQIATPKMEKEKSEEASSATAPDASQSTTVTTTPADQTSESAQT